MHIRKHKTKSFGLGTYIWQRHKVQRKQMSSVKTSILWKTMILKMKIQAIDWENKSHTGPRNDSHYIKKLQKPFFQKKKK